MPPRGSGAARALHGCRMPGDPEAIEEVSGAGALLGAAGSLSSSLTACRGTEVNGPEPSGAQLSPPRHVE